MSPPVPPLSRIPHPGWRSGLAQAAGQSWTTVLLIGAINTGIAFVLWTDDPRPFWHPLLTVQLYGFSIAYCVNVAAPWNKPSPILRMIVACAIGSLLGMVLTILLKGYSVDYVTSHWHTFRYNLFLAFSNGLLISLMFYVKFREARAATALHQAEAERHLLSKQAVEAELKLMQAQVEPHFLFNTLASVQFLTETDPPQASRLLSHLIDYLRAALPQFRASATTLQKEVDLAAAYLNILQMRLAGRLSFAVAVPPELAQHRFPPNLLVSLVENAVKHGIEPSADGGRVEVSARRDGGELIVTVLDTGRGAGTSAAPASGTGFGLANVRERLAALYGSRGRFTFTQETPRGARATLCIPFEPSA